MADKSVFEILADSLRDVLEHPPDYLSPLPAAADQVRPWTRWTRPPNRSARRPT